MCGIFAYLNFNVNRERRYILEVLFNGLRRLEYRGYDSSGISIDSDSNHSNGFPLLMSPPPLVFREEGNIESLVKSLFLEAAATELNLEESFCVHAGIAHTRWATHGEPSPRNSHPQTSGPDHEFLVVHNGVITNYEVLKETLIRHGFTFESDTDTEVIPKLAKYVFDKANEGHGDPTISFSDVVLEVMRHLDGAYALIFKSRHFPNQLIACKRGSPLLLGVKELTEDASVGASLPDFKTLKNGQPKELFISSDPNALVEHTKKVLVIEDGEVLHIKDGGVTILKFENEKGKNKGVLCRPASVQRALSILEMEVEQITKGKYEHYMQKEIHEQPESLRTTMRGRLIRGGFSKAKSVLLGGIKDHLKTIRRSRRIVFIGCGTSYNAALATRPILEELSGIPVTMEIASDLIDRQGPIYREDTAVFVSQSGETADTLQALEYALENGALCVGITNTVGSAIARTTHCGVHINAGAEIGVASTKAYTSQIAVMAMLALAIADDTISNQAKREAIIDGLFELPNRVREVLQLDQEMKELARQLIDEQSLLVFGRGYNYATALEGALKVKEVALMHSEGILAGEMKHGPLALVDENLPIVVIATRDSCFSKQQSVIQQLRARKGRLIVMCSKGDAASVYPSESCRVFEVPQVEDCLQPVINIIPLQKAKATWIGMGDCNTAYFHSQIKARRVQNRVIMIKDVQGVEWDTQPEIQEAFSSYYKFILGSSKQVKPVHYPTVQLGPTVSEDLWPILETLPSSAEIKDALFSIPDDKAPGPDGYTSKFFKDSWPIVGEDVCRAVKDFFLTGKLLKQINATVLTLIPKVTNPTSVTEFRPIACCNIISKCISKILCNKLGLVLPDLISPNQSAFVKGRLIVENVLICQDLVKLYTRKTCSPRCLLKIDLRKAYDSVEWSFVEDMLHALHFPEHLSNLIMVWVRSPWYSMALNGDTFGFFKGERGLRQGDPLSPLLFTICMEYLSRILMVVSKSDTFRHHPLCSKMRLTHLCFADDLLLFSRGDVPSVKLLLRGFLTFSEASGLSMNQDKSDLYCNGIQQGDLDQILQFSGFRKGSLPFKYLGVPISSKRLAVKDCFLLCERICARIRGWGAKRLSYSGRLTLVNSVLNTMHSYWASIYILPVAIMKRVVAICRNYLWDGSEEYHKAPLLSWDKVCVDKSKGGLSVIDCTKWNFAAVGKFVWWLAIKKDHLWVKWVNHIYLKGAEWLDYEPSVSSSWSWRQICKIKEMLKHGYTHRVWTEHDQYSISKGYDWLVGHHHKVPWAHDVWNKFNVPKWSFIAWLIRWKRLLTLDRLGKYGVLTDGVCFLCGCGAETCCHLFFGCVYSADCLKRLEEWLQVKVQQQNGLAICQRRNMSLFQSSVSVAAVNGLAYFIWMQRNCCRLDKAVLLPKLVVSQVKFGLLCRIDSLGDLQLKWSDHQWLARLRCL